MTLNVQNVHSLHRWLTHIPSWSRLW